MTHSGIAVLGIPLDENSSFQRGAALAPKAIRDAWHSESGNSFSERGIDLAAGGVRFVGDVDLANLRGQPALEEVTEIANNLLKSHAHLLALGGDHSVSWPLLRAQRDRHGPITVVQFDAHPDLYESFGGSRISHGCPFARVLEEGLVERLIQVGIRAATFEGRRQAERYGVEVLEMRSIGMGRVELSSLVSPDASVYVSFDLDALDPAFAPGVSHPEPGGLATRQALDAILELGDRIVGADVVELNPLRDPINLTALVAARVGRELVAAMLLRAAKENSP